MVLTNSVNIRPAIELDIPGIANVHVASWKTTYRGIVPDAHLDGLSIGRSIARWHDTFAESAANGWFTIVAEDPSGIVGFASAGPIRSDDPGYAGELGGIYLLKSIQRRGIGRRLVSDVAGRLRQQGRNSLLVWVLRENPSRGFYETLRGTYVREQVITIGGADLIEVAYGWQDTVALL